MKYFRDAVHGRIPVAEEYCKYIIDTLQFQRLKRIEQTSMRDLYPSAHHDRFVHSIGTYHIGRLMGEQIKNSNFQFNDILNSTEFLNSNERIKLVSIIKNFEAACLLHDCGHAPFSHTFENCFKYVPNYEIDMIKVVIKYITNQIGLINKFSYQPEEIEKVLCDYFILNRKSFEDALRRYLIHNKEKKGKKAVLEKVKQTDRDIDSFSNDTCKKERRVEDADEDMKSVYSDFNKMIKEKLPRIKNEKINKLFLILLEYFIDSSLESPKPHEIISAWLVLHEDGFGKVLQNKLGLDPLLMARMICGYKYHEFDLPTYSDDSKNNERIKEILNCFISLLNGKVIDADKLDYCLRDKWASGVNVNNIELNKLLQSLSICINQSNDHVVVCFSKGAIPEIESVIDSKNKVAYWCHNHHKIVYRQELLKNSVEKLAVVFAPKAQREEYQYLKRCRHELFVDCHTHSTMKVYDENWSFVGGNKGCYSLENNYYRGINKEKYETIFDFIKARRGSIEQNNIGTIFNYHSFISPQKVVINFGQSIYFEKLSLISDDDVMFFLRKFLLILDDSESFDSESELEKEFREDASKYVKDLFSRNQDLIPLWKSRAEFQSDFKKLVSPIDENINELEKNIEKKIGEAITNIRVDDGKELNNKNMPCRVICKKMNQTGIAKEDIFINTGGDNVCCYTKLDLLSKGDSTSKDFAYAFVPKVRKKNGEKESTWGKSREIYLEILNDIREL